MNERRRFFRLDDEVVLDFQLLLDDTICVEQQHRQLSEFQALEHEIGALIHQLRSQNPAFGRLAEVFNQKLNLLAGEKFLDQHNADNGAGERVEVNLSACGIAFASREALPKHAKILLNIQLKPSNAQLALIGRIVGVDAIDGDKPYLIRTEFENLSETQQELLIQHLFLLQSRHLKQRQEMP